MAVTYGFFNSVNGDRKYNAEQMSEYFRGIVNEGVFQHLDGGLAVTAGTGLAVNVASGRAIIQNRWVQNSDAMTLSISAASETYARKDAVVVRLNYSTRSIEIAVKAGTPAASPVAPSMTRNSTTYEMALAYVNVAANATSVTITDKRSDSTVCGWATVAQATSGEVDAQLNAMKTGFDGVTYASPAAMVQGEDQKLNDKMEDFIDDIFTYTTQYLDVNTKESGKYYYKDGIGKGTFSGLCVFPPFDVKAGMSYRLINVRSVFCTYVVGSTMESIDPTDNGAHNKTLTFTPANDGQLYVTGGDDVTVMAFDNNHQQSEYVYGRIDWKIDPSVIGEDTIEPKNCTFFKICKQLLVSSSAESGYYNINGAGKVDISSNANTLHFQAIPLKAGNTYQFLKMYGYFCIIADANKVAIERVTNNTSSGWNGTYTPEVDCYLYASVLLGDAPNAMVCNDTKYLPPSYIEGEYYRYIREGLPVTEVNLHVKTDGTGDYTSVVDAVNFANADKNTYPINIYVHSGDYDILTELGGQTFIDTIASSTDERQGLCLKRNNVNLIGVGFVTLRFEMPGTVTLTQSTRVSCLNLREYTNRVENMTLIAKNCRYVIHDETNGGNPYIHRVMKNLRCIHKGNASGLWPYPTVMGGGAGGGSTYDIINCQFLTSTHFQAFSYHTNYNEEASFFNVDGCVASSNNSGSNAISFRFSYHGPDRTGICVANVKCCSGNGSVVVQPEASGDAELGSNIELYKNGWETIDPIPVSGDE